jgi:ESAT-6 family protein
MTINYQFGDVTAHVAVHGATIRAQESRWRPGIKPSSATCGPLLIFGAAPGSVTWHGQKVQTAGSNMASTDSAVGSGWA